MAELELERLSLRFGGLAVLDRVSLAVNKGELFALIGPNGAGKTSVLNCISGIYRGEGQIRFRGADIAGHEPHKIARLGLARTFQHGELFPQMSVLENLLTGRHARIRTNPLAEMLFLGSVRTEEIRHREVLEDRYRALTGKRFRYEPSKVDSESLPIPTSNATAIEALELAMEHELEAVDNYRVLAADASNEESRRVYLELANDEQQHYEWFRDQRDALQGGVHWFTETLPGARER